MQTSVQLAFSFEIAAMQLTPTFKIGVLQVRPMSKIVTMRLAPSQQAQLEVNFEIAKIQRVGKSIGTIRLTPSQQQSPMMGSRSAAGLQFMPNGEATPVQFVPSQQSQAAVVVTVPCQLTTIEFSPLLEIASVVLNSSSKQVLVQLAGAGPSPADGPRAFEIADLQLSERGDAGMIELNLIDESPTDDAVNAMLLNGAGTRSEFASRRRVEEQGAMIARQQKQIEALTAAFQKPSAQLELARSSPQTVVSN